MTDIDWEKLIKSTREDGKRIDRDPKYALEVFIRMGIMTPKGNLTRPWQKIRKHLGVVPRNYEGIRRYMGLS